MSGFNSRHRPDHLVKVQAWEGEHEAAVSHTSPLAIRRTMPIDASAAIRIQADSRGRRLFVSAKSEGEARTFGTCQSRQCRHLDSESSSGSFRRRGD